MNREGLNPTFTLSAHCKVLGNCRFREKKKRRRKHSETDEYKRLILQDFNPETEALAFYTCYLRGGSLEKLRADIGVPDHVVACWEALRDEGDWDGTVALARMLPLRRKTLALFDHLVATGGQRDFA